MAINYGERQFNELEKRLVAFKGMFGVYNSTTGKLVSQERYPKGFKLTLTKFLLMLKKLNS